MRPAETTTPTGRHADDAPAWRVLNALNEAGRRVAATTLIRTQGVEAADLIDFVEGGDVEFRTLPGDRRMTGVALIDGHLPDGIAVRLTRSGCRAVGSPSNQARLFLAGFTPTRAWWRVLRAHVQISELAVLALIERGQVELFHEGSDTPATLTGTEKLADLPGLSLRLTRTGRRYLPRAIR